MSGLYDWRLHPIGGGPPFPHPTTRPLVGQVICTADPPSSPAVARVWLIDPTNAVRFISPRILGELVAALDEGLPIAVLGDDVERVRIACGTILQMAGGAHA